MSTNNELKIEILKRAITYLWDGVSLRRMGINEGGFRFICIAVSVVNNEMLQGGVKPVELLKETVSAIKADVLAKIGYCGCLEDFVVNILELSLKTQQEYQTMRFDLIDELLASYGETVHCTTAHLKLLHKVKRTG